MVQSFALLLVSPGKPVHQVIQCPTANFSSLSRDRVTDQKLITTFDTYLTPRSQGASKKAWSLNQDHSDSECSALTHFSKGLTYYATLKESYNQDINGQVVTKNIQKKEEQLYMKSPTPET